MSQVSHQAVQSFPTANLFAFVAYGATSLFARMQQGRQQMRDRKLLNELGDAALKDAGIDRSAVCHGHPTIEVKAGLMARLMTMS